MNGDLLCGHCTYKQAKHAVMNWHYSKKMPVGKLVSVGFWEHSKFIGCVIFGRGGSPAIGNPYKLCQTQCVELVRVALFRGHIAPTTRIISEALCYLKKTSPGIELVVSFADEEHGHHGGIYQAGNWYYDGLAQRVAGVGSNLLIHGKRMHTRSASTKYGTGDINWIRENVDVNAQRIRQFDKHKYIYPLTRRARKICESRKQPYPKPTQNNNDKTTRKKAQC